MGKARDLPLPTMLPRPSRYGERTEENVIDNLAKDNPVTAFVRIFLCIDLLFTGVLFFFPVSQGLEQEIWSATQLADGSVEWQRNALRTTLVVATAVISLVIPYAQPRCWLVCSLAGSYGAHSAITCAYLPFLVAV